MPHGDLARLAAEAEQEQLARVQDLLAAARTSLFDAGSVVRHTHRHLAREIERRVEAVDTLLAHVTGLRHGA